MQHENSKNLLPKLEKHFSRNKYGDLIMIEFTYDELAYLVAAVRAQHYTITQIKEVVGKLMDRGLGKAINSNLTESQKLGIEDLIKKDGRGR